MQRLKIHSIDLVMLIIEPLGIESVLTRRILKALPSSEKVFVFTAARQNGLTAPRLLGSDIEKLLCIHYTHIISIICGLNLEMIEQSSSIGFITG